MLYNRVQKLAQMRMRMRIFEGVSPVLGGRTPARRFGWGLLSSNWPRL